MEEGSKRRLVGTAVVVVLLVIFLPMLLEEKPVNPVPDSDLEIPPRPEFDADLDAEPSAPLVETFGLPTTPALPSPDSYDEAPPEPTPPVEARSAAAADRESVAVAKSPSPDAPDPARTSSSGPLKDESRPLPPQSGPGWVVQVSSLTERSRAKALEQELRAKGFPAFIEKAEVGGKTYHRVRVGPRTERAEIETLAASLRREAGYQGQILRYP
jgi:DedD protein